MKTIVGLLICALILGVYGKGVHIGVSSNWEDKALTFELVEALSHQSDEPFWRYISSYQPLEGEYTPKQQFESAWELAENFTSRDHQDLLLRYSVASRYYNPVVMTHLDLAEHDFNRFSESEECKLNEPFVIIQWNGILGEELFSEIPEVNEEDLVGDEEKPLVEYEFHEFFSCNPDTIRKVIDDLLKRKTKQETWNGVILPSEHRKGAVSASFHILVYADFTTKEYKNFHFIYENIANYTYVNAEVMFRHSLSTANSGNGDSVSLQGYGVEISLKNTEYLTVNENEDAPKGTSVDSSNEIETLKESEIADLSLQAAYAAKQVTDVWGFLSDLTGNFPSIANTLAKVELSEEDKLELVEPSKTYGNGRESITINGRNVNLYDINPFEIYSMIKEEFDLRDALELMDVPTSMIKQFMNMKIDSQQYRMDLRNDHVLWLNDVETDPQYSKYPGTLYELFKPSYPDQIRFIKKNLVNIVIVCDPLSSEALEIYPVVDMFINGGAPLRLSFLFNPVDDVPRSSDRDGSEDPLSNVVISCYYYLYKNHGANEALRFLNKLSAKSLESESEITLDDIKASTDVFSDVYSPAYVTDADIQIMELSNFMKNSGLRGEQLYFMNGVPKSSFDFSNSGITNAVKDFIRDEYTHLQYMLWKGQLKDSDNVYNVLLNGDGVYDVYNSIVIENESYVPILGLTLPIINERTSFNLASEYKLGLGEFLAGQVDYISAKGSNKLPATAITHYLVADLSTTQGLRTLIELAKRIDLDADENEDVRDVRFAVIHNPGCLYDANKIMTFEDKACFVLYNDLVNIAGRAFTTKKYSKFITKVMPIFLPDSGATKVDVMDEIAVKVKSGTTRTENFVALWKNEPWKFRALHIHRYLLNQIFGDTFEPGRNYIITNGRVTEIPTDMEYFPSSGFSLLEKMERKKGKEIYDILSEHDFQHVIDQEPFQTIDKKMDIFKSELIMKVSSVLSYYNTELGRSIYTPATSSNSVPVSMNLVLDPLSKTTRTIAPIMKDLLATFGNQIETTVTFNPTPELTELPLSGYYRYVINTNSFNFNEDGSLRLNGATFTDLPEVPVLTVAVESPSSWMVQSLVSQYDLDNLILKDVSEEFVFAEYVLRNLVIQGSAMDDTKMPPRGTELVLTDLNENESKDTIVMANLGYFQLQANPGIWNLDVADGRSSTVFSLSDEQKTFIVDSFATPYQTIKLTRNEGIEDSVSVLDFPSEKSNKQDQTIHVFSLASGHLYERFLKIMIVSTLKNTESPVKFWFVENFLSPKFKEVVFEMSKQYGFEVELISYQWPQWLYPQTEKQRVIWAYKILFLDVLFPLDVHRVIFVDADLIVRGDLRELNELDLEGAPYAYTPFCDSREEMEGFRFWKTGFWKDHLSSIDAKYHISALYVVDLDNFRNNAVGDILRGMYSSLSQDPNSLANLDQDLPNFTQNNIPIYSLDKSWLWCETWCSDEDKESAKAIDLCNNPMTKTPKLENAMRIVPEWSDLDKETKNISVPESKHKTIHPNQIGLAMSVHESWTSLKTSISNPTEYEHKLHHTSDSWMGDIVEE